MDPDDSYREEANAPVVNRSVDDEGGSNPQGRPPSESAVQIPRGRSLEIGTWNVRTLYQPGKRNNLVQEMQKMNLDILGIGETHWTGKGKIVKESHTLIYSCGKQQRNRVGI